MYLRKSYEISLQNVMLKLKLLNLALDSSTASDIRVFQTISTVRLLIVYNKTHG